ncbi:hypothetical protein H105_06768 [Trichophyton soudanense CBS 452.61]|uniref:Uncharacterized protein n=1 Tax=Trichophyton soudanense CBS 452.61 TaxID=1215331 RepID=A0A022XL08_TRISD|nr:hypothetical protein H105_06768 [Trichophyton soudanense CBS 452.61]
MVRSRRYMPCMVSKQRPKMGLHRDELEENEEAEEAEEAEEKKKKKKKKQASTASILHGSSEPVIANHIQTDSTSIHNFNKNPLALQGNCSSPALGQALYASGTSRRRKSKEPKSLARDT